MTRWYLDTSAAAKLLVDETESAALAHAVTAEQPDLLACYLLETEIRRLVHRYDGLTQGDATALLDSVALHEVPPSLFREAGLLGTADLRSLDALHIAAAVRLGVDAVLTYDPRMAACARDLGVAVLAPA
jgi:predicted nucleic acid-binding protein